MAGLTPVPGCGLFDGLISDTTANGGAGGVHIGTFSFVSGASKANDDGSLQPDIGLHGDNAYSVGSGQKLQSTGPCPVGARGTTLPANCTPGRTDQADSMNNAVQTRKEIDEHPRCVLGLRRAREPRFHDHRNAHCVNVAKGKHTAHQDRFRGGWTLVRSWSLLV